MVGAKHIQLNTGERFDLSAKQKGCRILAGKVEVYGTDLASRERLYLRTKSAGQFVFAFCDEFNMVEVSLLVKETAEIVFYDRNDIEKLCNGLPDDGFGMDELTLRRGMQEWFSDLLQLEWVNYYAIHNDEIITRWAEGKFIMEAPPENLPAVFEEHQGVLVMLVIGRFELQNKFYRKRLEETRNRKNYLVTDSLELISGTRENSGATKTFAHENYSVLVAKVLNFYQMDEVDLSMLEYLGKRLKGMDLLKYTIRKGNMRFRKVRLEKDWFKKDSGVIFVGTGNKWRLALPLGNEGYELWDVDGRHQPLTEEISGELDDNGLICYPGFANKKINCSDFLRFIYATTWKNDYLVILLSSIVLGLIPLLTPIITDSIFSDVIPTNNYGNLATITQVMLVSSFSAAALTIVRSVAVVRIVTHTGVLTEAAIFSRLLSLPVGFFKRYSVGELTTRLLNFTQVKALITGQFVAGIFNFLFGLWSLVLMFCYSVRLSFVALGVWMVYFGLSWANIYRYPKHQSELMRANNEQSAMMVDLVNNLGKFRSKGGTEQVFHLWAQKFMNSWQYTLKIRWMNNRSELLNVCLSIVLMLVLYCFAAYDMKNADPDAISATTFMAFNVAYTGFNMALLQLMPELVQLMGMPAYWDNFVPLLQEKTETGSGKMEAGELTGEIELRRVAFRYDEDGPEVLKDINIHIRPGEKVAFVGGSGCGKSTLVRLLLGFEQPTKGMVLYDSTDFGELDAVSVRRQMGVVLQGGKLLMAPILHNIIGSNNLTIDDAWEAAKLVALDKDIEKMPMGMHTLINDASGNISGGQRQRILLARSIVNKPKILILDEATSALDNVTQAMVSENLAKMNLTQIIIAHRLSTLRDVDRIFVIDKGVIAEEGTYEELMALGGLFTQLAKRQIS